MLTTEQNLAEKFIFRGESYKEGMLLLIEYLTDKDWRKDKQATSFSITLKINTLFENYDKAIKTVSCFEAGKEYFDTLLAEYNEILVSCTTLTDGFHSLLLAERCSVWQKGWKSFDTELVEPSSEGLTLVQREVPCMDSGILLQEYSQLATATPPRWFQCLPLWQQNFIKKNQQALAEQPIPSSLRCVPGLANLSKHSCMIDGAETLSYFRHATQAPIDLMMDKEAGDTEQFRLTCLNIAAQIRLSLEDKVPDAKCLREVVILSQSILSPGFAATVKSQFSGASDNDTQIYAMKERGIKLFQRALTKPDTPISAEDSIIKHLFFNQDEQANPLQYKDFLAKLDLFAQSNGSFKYKEFEPKFKITLVSTNHPFNLLRRFGVHAEQTKHNAVNTALLLGAVARYLSDLLLAKKNASNRAAQFDRFPQVEKYINRYKLLEDLNRLIKNLSSYAEEEIISTTNKENLIKILGNFQNDELARGLLGENCLRLLNALQVLLSTPQGQGVFEEDERHQQMLISSVEASIVHSIGGTLWVACKSGKDRTGGASAAYDATAVFYQQYGQHPRHDDQSERVPYLDLLADFLNSDHQQSLASKNAPGAHGLVKPDLFLPSDMKLAAKTVKLATQFARLNKPRLKSKRKNDPFNLQILVKELDEIRDLISHKELGTSTTLSDWQRNWEYYRIEGKNIKTLRKDRNFESEEDLSAFIEQQLLHKIENENLKKYYLVLFLYAFHQGGFPHAFATANCQLLNPSQQANIFYGQPDIQVNFRCLDNTLQIEEINTYYTAKDQNGTAIQLEENERYHLQTNSSITVALTKASTSTEGYHLETKINAASVDCKSERLQTLFCKKSSLLERIIDFFIAFLEALRRYLHIDTGKPATREVLDENWLNSCRPAQAKGISSQYGRSVLNVLSELPRPIVISTSQLADLSTETLLTYCLPPKYCLSPKPGFFKQSLTPKHIADKPQQSQELSP